MLTAAILGLRIGDVPKSSRRMSNVMLEKTLNDSGKEGSAVVHPWSVTTETPG